MTNAGNRPTSGNWQDRVVIRNARTGQVLVSANVAHDAVTEGALAPGGARATQYSFRLPDGDAGFGDLVFTVTVDVTNTQVEYDGTAGAEANNTAATERSSTLAPYPDLRVQNLTTSPADGIQSGTTLVVRWEVANAGNRATAGSWYDLVQIRNKATGQLLLSRAVSYDAAAQGNGPIDPNGVRSRQTTYTLPDGDAGVGELDVTVTTDHGNGVFEYNTAGTAETNNAATITRDSTLAPYPDLVVSNIVAPPDALSGEAIEVSWTLTNRGTGRRPGPGSTTSISPPTRPSATTSSSASFAFTGTIAAGQSLVRTQTITLPRTMSGDRWVIVRAECRQRRSTSTPTRPTTPPSTTGPSTSAWPRPPTCR